MNGINKNAFIDCYGLKYSKLSHDFLMIFNKIKDEFLRDFANSMNEVCPQYTQPCNDIVVFVDENILKDPDITEELESFSNVRKNLLAVDSFLLDDAIQKFKARYTLYMSYRNAIAKEAISTQNMIVKYIKSSKIQDFDEFDDFSVTDFMASLGMIDKDKVQGFGTYETSDDDQVQMQSNFAIRHATKKSYESSTTLIDDKVNKLSRKIQSLTTALSSKKELTDRSLNGNNFLIKLVSEVQDQKLLQYYLASGSVDATTLDLTLLPSQIMDQIKRNKINLAGLQKK
jgi:hypothetical protein